MWIEHNNIRISPDEHVVEVRREEIPFTATEFKILFDLMVNRKKVLSRDWLIDTAIGHRGVTDRTIDTHIARIRKKLGSEAHRIRTLIKVGYKFI